VALSRAPEYLRLLGVNHLGVWFIDLHAILASCDAVAAGLDPYAYNPLDHFGRVHCYPHWWLLLGSWGFTRADTQWLGFLLVAVFFVSAVVALRPRLIGELFWMLAVLCSPPVLLALERANIDLVVFVLLAPVVPCLMSRRPLARLMAVPLIVAATMLKVYPLVAAVVLLGAGSGREMRRLIGVGIVLLAVALPDMIGDFQRYARHLPEPEGLMTMGARNLFTSFGLPAGAARWWGRARRSRNHRLFLANQAAGRLADHASRSASMVGRYIGCGPPHRMFLCGHELLLPVGFCAVAGAAALAVAA
jgi:hypothetical protein